MYQIRTTTKGGGKFVVAEKTARAALTRIRQLELSEEDAEVVLADGTPIDLTELEAFAASEKP